MPYRPRSSAIEPSEELPQHLEHKPVYAFPYEHFDGYYAGKTDTKYISIGIAQYNLDEVSVKTMRYTGEKWTRLAEELPLHRAIDLTLFLAEVIFNADNGVVRIQKGTFYNQNVDISITRENRSYGELASYNAFLDQKHAFLKERLNILADVLNELRKAGKI
jgi:hypothetical protein